MIIGTIKEIKNHEYRVGLLPTFAREYIKNNHTVIVEQGAGAGVGATDQQYRDVGAEIVSTPDEVFSRADMIIKVKEPQPSEIAQLRSGCILYTYLHLAADRSLTLGLQESGAICIAYETVTDKFGGLPLLTPMSEVAGRMSVQVGARCLEREYGGKGLLLSGVPGTKRANVVIVGGGVAGLSAARIAVGMGAQVTIIDRSLVRLREIDHLFSHSVQTRFALTEVFEEVCATADLVIGSVLIPGAAAPRLVTRDMLKTMEKGSVLVDISIDQGGCFETSRPTSHSNPTFSEEGMIHYCVTNMPGAVPQTSTSALNNATLNHGLAIANKGWRDALLDDPHLRDGLNVFQGHITNEAVSHTLGLPYTPTLNLLKRS